VNLFDSLLGCLQVFLFIGFELDVRLIPHLSFCGWVSFTQLSTFGFFLYLLFDMVGGHFI